MFFSGCTSSPKQIGPKRVTQWAYAPNTIHVHPLSRIRVSEEGAPSVVAHISMLDGDGFACRGVGVLTVRIGAANGDVLDIEVINLQDAEENRSYFDAVTRTYQIESYSLPQSTSRVTLSATFLSAEKRSIQSNTSTLINHDTN